MKCVTCRYVDESSARVRPHPQAQVGKDHQSSTPLAIGMAISSLYYNVNTLAKLELGE